MRQSRISIRGGSARWLPPDAWQPDSRSGSPAVLASTIFRRSPYLRGLADASEEDLLVIERIVEKRINDLVRRFKVRRVLPGSARENVAPIFFFDHLEPRMTIPRKLDVRSHSHIGSPTDGALIHRDDLSRKELCCGTSCPPKSDRIEQAKEDRIIQPRMKLPGSDDLDHMACPAHWGIS